MDKLWLAVGLVLLVGAAVLYLLDSSTKTVLGTVIPGLLFLGAGVIQWYSRTAPGATQHRDDRT